MTLYRLVYRSEAAFSGDDAHAEAELREIAGRCGPLNEAAGVSGAAMLSGRSILHAIEGPSASVEATFERICGDVRHRRVQLVEFGSVAERRFAEWPMAVVATHGGISALCGRQDFFAGGRLDPATVEAMLRLMRSMILTEGGAGVPLPLAGRG